MVRAYDKNRDGLLDHDELLRFATGNAGPKASFVLRSSAARSDPSRSQVKNVLDDDGDGAVSSEEAALADVRLLQFDADDDESIALADFTPDIQAGPRRLSGRRPDEPDAAIWITDRTNWNYVLYSLAEFYAYGGDLAAGDLALTPDLVNALDTDEDGTVSEEEVSGLAETPPHLVLQASFDEENTPEGSPRARLHLQSLSDHLQAKGVEVCRQAMGFSFAWADMKIDFFVNEDPLLYSTSVDTVDMDGDGKLNQCELAQYLIRRQSVFRGLVRAQAAVHEDAFFAALDTDASGSLNAREIQQAPERLLALDRNQDGQLQSHELPHGMAVGFVRGDPRRDSEFFSAPCAAIASSQIKPSWFTGMDTNEDGEISPREFLGTGDQFRQLDRDTDGYICASEANQRLAQ
jgi:Ca2+-binding EF-hand superfamily protein